MPRMTHTQAFAHFGTKPKNTYWSWSARNEQTNIVVCTLWQDQFSRANGRLTYSMPRQGPRVWRRTSPGFNELMDNLAWALERCNGKLHVIIAIPEVSNGQIRIRECFPSKLIMKLVHFDRDSGDFRAEAQE